jgi:peptide/nickel transport system ATP-binding protein
MPEADLLTVDDLSVDYLQDAGRVRAVDGVSFQVAPGEVFGLVGESGSGKSTLAQALLRLLLPPAVIAGGRVLLHGRDLVAASDRELLAVRGRQVSLVPQSGMNALNPLLPVSRQIADGIRAHEPVALGPARSRARELCQQLGLPRAAADSYPHELSGGMRQRAVIAMAMALRPGLLILDEPTAALDVILARDILAQILALQADLRFSILFISHDLALTLALCARVGVLHRGRLVENGPVRELLGSPRHPYTRALLNAFQSTARTAPAGAPDAAAPALLSVRGLGKTFVSGWGRRARRVRAVDDASFDLRPGEALALVGESGSGKSTIVRLLARLLPPSQGEIVWQGRNVLAHERRRASLRYRAAVQMVFQDPFAALNPARRVSYHLQRALQLHSPGLDSVSRGQRLLALLESVGLTPPQEVADKYPHQLSGGQRQRVCIARALAVAPSLLLADEPASMLDASIRLDVVAILQRLKTERGLAVLYVTHDLVGARAFADRLLVLYAGRIVESGPAADLLDRPAHPYTAMLLAALPDMTGPTPRLADWQPGAVDAASTEGCAFASRCPRVVDRCRNQAPQLREIAPGRLVRCFYPLVT